MRSQIQGRIQDFPDNILANFFPWKLPENKEIWSDREICASEMFNWTLTSKKQKKQKNLEVKLWQALTVIYLQ